MRRALFTAILLLTAVAAQAQQPQLRVKYRHDTNTIDLAWTQVAGASTYVVRRASSYPLWEAVTNVGNNSSLSLSLGQNTAYVFQVQALDSAGAPFGAPSAGALATTSGFTEHIMVGTPVRAAHVNELRTLVNRARTAAGLSNATWTFPTRAAGDPVKTADVAELRTALNAALQNIGQVPPAFTDPALTTSTVVRKVHVNELRTRVINWPELVVPTTATITENYFSPNGDSVKDSTRVDVAFRVTTEVSWRLNVRNAANAVVRTLTGFGTGFSFTWDGRNGSGAMQPDGTYWFDVFDVNGFATSMTTSLWATIDTAAPSATIASPAQSQTLSNMFANGSGTFTITGGVTDANLASWQLERTGNALPNVTMNSGTSPIQPTATLATWQTIPASGDPLPAGPYVLRITASDRAGNQTTLNRDVSVGHFTAALAGNHLDTTATPAQTVRYTSKVPFTLDEVVTVRRADGTVVRTLFSGSRLAGTHDDFWNGRDDAGVLLADGMYFLFAEVTANGTSFTWNQSANMLGGGFTQFEYPTCRNDANQLVPCNSSTLTFDPYRNKPLRINFCVGSGDVATGCSGGGPSKVIAKISGVNEDGGACDNHCFAEYTVGPGPQEILWYGTNRAGQYIADGPTRLLVLRGGTYPRNSVTLIGTAPKISVFDIKPMYWFNPAGPAGQDFVVDIVSPAGRALTLSAKFRNMTTLSVLRTIALAPSTATRQTLTWDGRADNQAWVAPGNYEVTLTVTDSAGGTATVKPIVAVRY
ncbi:MAG TPA: FlgD immunoglobulin-like domain containing protein [Thermoanaerobaculia bacterium]|nr:FlgD immunoglobulin-like domain containing protein [Thermoanaerobaculia bacterium]